MRLWHIGRELSEFHNFSCFQTSFSFTKANRAIVFRSSQLYKPSVDIYQSRLPKGVVGTNLESGFGRCGIVLQAETQTRGSIFVNTRKPSCVKPSTGVWADANCLVPLALCWRVGNIWGRADWRWVDQESRLCLHKETMKAKEGVRLLNQGAANDCMLKGSPMGQ